MTEQLTIQKFPFKRLGGAGEEQPKAAGFQSLPHKIISNESQYAAQVRTSEAVEKPKEPLFSEKDVLETRQRSFEEGYAKGYSGAKSAEAELEKKVQANLDDIAIKLAAIGEVIKTRNNVHIKELAELALRIARKVAGTALKNAPYEEIENAVRSSLPLLFEEPRINISVSPDVVQNIKERITLLAKNEGFRNNIEVLANPAITAGSCNIEWNGGGIRSNKDEVWKRIEELCGDL